MSHGMSVKMTFYIVLQERSLILEVGKIISSVTEILLKVLEKIGIKLHIF